MKRKAKRISYLAKQLAALQIPTHAGYTAFFLLLSIFPLTVALLTVLQYLPATIEDLWELLMPVLPSAIRPFFTTVFDDLSRRPSFTLLSAFSIAALWSAIRTILSLMSGLNAVYRLPESRPLLWRWGLSLLSYILFFLAILAMLFLHVFSRFVYRYAEAHRWANLGLFDALVRLRMLFSLGFLTLLFALFYKLLPNAKLRYLRQLPGALLAAGGWLLFSWLFGIYADSFSSYSSTYGSLTTVIVTLLWLYFCLMILLYGGLCNRLLADYPRPFRALRDALRQK